MPPQNAVATTEQKVVSFVPFGSEKEIKLSMNIIDQFVAVKTKQGKGPSPGDCMKFLMLCQSQRLNPFAGDCYLIGYDTQDGPKFSIVTSISAMNKRAEASPNFNGMQSGIIYQAEGDAEIKEREGDFFSEGETVLGGWAKVYRKDHGHPCYRRVKMSTYKKGFGVWANDPAGMIVKVAEMHALRDSFPSLLGSLKLEQEVIDVQTTTEIAKPIFGREALPAPVANTNEPASLPAKQSPASELEPENQAPPTAAHEPTPVERLIAAGVEFDDFAGFCRSSGICADTSSWAGYDSLPAAVVEILDERRVAKCCKLFGKK
jgi:phage recombination protein Bet